MAMCALLIEAASNEMSVKALALYHCTSLCLFLLSLTTSTGCPDRVQSFCFDTFLRALFQSESYHHGSLLVM